MDNFAPNFFLGCAVWAYKGWIGDFYPPKSQPTNFLKLYSQRFTTVEGNTTFYVTPNKDTVARWAAETPQGFTFCPKIPKALTHQGLLVPMIPEVLKFLELMGGLGDRLGVTFAQLPPSYSPAHTNDLTQFLKALSQSGYATALEVRHPAWFREPYASNLTETLQQFGIGRVLLDSRPIYESPEPFLPESMPSERRKPRLPLQISMTADFSFVRFVSHPDRSYNQPFLAEWATWIETWLQQNKRIYFFMHCPIEERSPHNALYFQQMLEQQNLPVPALPWTKLAQPAQQLQLF
ncbi:DUF72 domain-containing protein [Tumidithrix elongata RA019]|uniref:DUF72 domain-containing protein n=1 Tax=Tumidithrix elongata BACA0141 TaxID=2716417 RepID=A0AAW9PYW3_9CYAN|nr:DUF72 domain-containing protein [Tumidithrix elongata RA019]